MVPVKVTISGGVTTAADGSFTGYTDEVSGRLLAIRYVKSNFDNGSTMTVTLETTGIAVWAESNVDASATRLPRTQVCGPTGTALTYDGTRTVNEPIVVAKERIKLVVASGGNAKTGTFYFVLG